MPLNQPSQGEQPVEQKNNSAQRDSEHASISFTAHYTGEMWQSMGLSHPALATQLGKRFHKLLSPVEWAAKRFAGVSIGKTLTQRHLMMDAAVIRWIEAHPTTQIVELAAGLSPRGWRLLNRFKLIDYLEVDLPQMSALKQERATQLPDRVPTFCAADIFTDEFEKQLSKLDPARPLLFVSEGLINYFTLEQITQLQIRLMRLGIKHPACSWVTEMYPEHNHPWINHLTQFAFKFLKVLTRSQFSTQFVTPIQAREFFEKQGDTQVELIQPAQPESNCDHHLGDSVWILTITLNTPKLGDT